MSELLSALLGAIFAGSIQFVVSRVDRANKIQTVLNAIAAEVGTCCEFIRIQNYVEQYKILAEQGIRDGTERLPPIDAQQNYFTIYESVASELGLVGSIQAAKIVRFYTLLKIAIDTARPDSLFDGSRQNATFMHSLASELLTLGEEISKFPKRFAEVRRLA